MSKSKLKDRELRSLYKGQSTEKTGKLYDGDGLYLLIKKTKQGIGMYWRYDYTFNRARKTLSYGTYPRISLTNARQKHTSARSQLLSGINPAQDKKAPDQTLTFQVVAETWLHLPQNAKRWKDSYKKVLQDALSKDVYPYIQSTPIDQIKPLHIVEIISAIDSRGAPTIAERTLNTLLKPIFRYAITCGYIERNVADIDSSMLISPRIRQNRATLHGEQAIGQLMYKLEHSARFSIQTRALLMLSPYLMLRPSELRQAQWEHIDFEQKVLTIPAANLKLKQHIKTAIHAGLLDYKHSVPLSSQALTLFQNLKDQAIHPIYIFPSAKRSSKSPCLEVHTAIEALRRLGYDKTQMSVHGFRAMASTLLNESGQFNPDAIERQLAHIDKNDVRRAYNHAQYWDERVEMMQWLADYLDRCKLNAASVS